MGGALLMAGLLPSCAFAQSTDTAARPFVQEQISPPSGDGTAPDVAAVEASHAEQAAAVASAASRTAVEVAPAVPQVEAAAEVEQDASLPPSASEPAIEPDIDDPLESELDERQTSFPDPLENLNRRTLGLNQTVDRWVISPVTRAYGYVVPDRAKQSVRDFFSNLESPAIFVNDVLQGEIGGAATTIARFSVNTIFGLAGLFDPASSIGLERHSADFGQTLAMNGVGSGPFLIVPLLGPTTVRDGIGTLVDVALQPTIYLLGPAPLVVASVQEGTDGLTFREAHDEDLQRLEGASLDYYAALRSAYYQNRMATLGEGPGAAGQSTAEAVASATPEDPPT